MTDHLTEQERGWLEMPRVTAGTVRTVLTALSESRAEVPSAHGSSLKPATGCADTYGEGMRMAKQQVRAALAPAKPEGE